VPEIGRDSALSIRHHGGMSEVIVRADYSQFYVNNIGWLETEFTDTFLAHNFEGYGNLKLVTARQWGEIPVEVQVHDARPAELDDSWQDAVEASIIAQELTTVSGWTPERDDLLPPLIEGTRYRVRYAIQSGDRAPEERYRLDFWPEQPSPARVICQDSEFGRHWKEHWDSL
jgi:hypothetical protein